MTAVRLAARETDGWELRSAEAAHAASPATFWIPPLERRRALRIGQAAKLLFAIRGPDGRGHAGERMWVVVSDRVGETYIGRLANAPADLPGDAGHDLCVGAEVPFRAEHVADVDDPPEEYAQDLLRRAPARRWPRGG